jgi:O-antigen ligase
MSPVFYRFAYGYHPSEQVGASRVMFYRPLLACEDGNQLGMFLASVALLGAWLWIGGGRSTSADAPAPNLVRDALLGGLLVVALLLAQSMGAILLFLFGLAMLFALRWVRFEWLMLGLLAPLVIGAGVRLSGAVSVESLQSDPRVQWLMREGPLPPQRLGSLGWRLKRQEEHLQTALKKPILGWGHPHWWWNSPKAGYRGGYRPWGLWLLVLGSYGSLGFATWALAVSLPMLVLLRRRPPPTLAVSALAVVLLINVVDGLLNSVFLLPLVPVAGGLLNVFERLGGSARPTRQVAPSTKHRWGHGSGSAREREKAPRSSQSDRGAIK